MKLKFIGQGLNPASNITVGNFIIDSLESSSYSSFNAFVAFVSTGGLKNVIDEMLDFKKRGGKIKLYLGVNLNATSKEALEQLLKNHIESYVIFSPNNIIYHPKIYAFEGDKKTRAIIGSVNMTERGLFQNIEASVCVDFKNDDESGNEFLADIYDHFNTIINQEHKSCQLLTKEVLQILIESKVVLPEAVARRKNFRINKSFGQIDAKANTRLLKLFGKLKAKLPPKSSVKRASKQRNAGSKAKRTSAATNVKITKAPTGAMWIETGSMTGGSRNILDLSKRGNLNGAPKFGSVSYFGLNPNNMQKAKDIDLIFRGKTYKHNRIFYAERNSNWRIRINGKTIDGEKMTVFSKPRLGQKGGFQSKILVFNKINNTHFELEIFRKSELAKLIKNSSDWARGGNSISGRAYGILK
jgi:HKD family nuclease